MVEIHYIPCFLCATRPDDFQGEGELEIGDNFNKFAKFKIDLCPLCRGKGRLSIKPYTEKSWNKNRRDRL